MEGMVEGQMVIVSAGVRPNIEVAGRWALDIGTGSWSMTGWRPKLGGSVCGGRCGRASGPLLRDLAGGSAAGRGGRDQYGRGGAVYKGTTVSNTLKIVGIDLTSIGEIDTEGKLECIVRSDREKCVYGKDGLYGRTGLSAVFSSAI